MAFRKRKPLHLSLYESAYTTTAKVVESAVSKIPEVEFKIPTGHVKAVMKHMFSGDGTRSAREHIELIEEICGLFRITGVSEDYVKEKLLFTSLSGNARDWYRSLDKEAITEWSVLRKIFFLKYFTPREAYENRCFIFNFWPHLGESITQAWGRLKALLRENPCHDLTRKLILINFYVRLPMKHKEILDNSSGGSFTNNTEEEAWNLLETISENTGHWELDKGNEPYFDYGYSCVENYSTSILFKNMSDTFNLDPYVILEIAKSFV